MTFAKAYLLLGILCICGFDNNMYYFIRLKTIFFFKILNFLAQSS